MARLNKVFPREKPPRQVRDAGIPNPFARCITCDTIRKFDRHDHRVWPPPACAGRLGRPPWLATQSLHEYSVPVCIRACMKYPEKSATVSNGCQGKCNTRPPKRSIKRPKKCWQNPIGYAAADSSFFILPASFPLSPPPSNSARSNPLTPAPGLCPHTARRGPRPQSAFPRPISAPVRRRTGPWDNPRPLPSGRR